jgi:hypothetical protein
VNGANTGLGLDVLSNITSGYRNSAFGYQALISATSSGNNTAIGAAALGSSALSGTDNTAVGSFAGFGIRSGSRNTVVGSNSVSGLVADDNVAVGYDVNPIQGTTRSVLIGNSVSHGAASPVDSVIIGNRALYNAYSYARNSVLIGSGAGFNAGGNSGTLDAQTFIGYQAGYNVDRGWGNLLIGASSSPNLTDGFNNLIIGNNVFATSSNRKQLAQHRRYSLWHTPSNINRIPTPNLWLTRCWHLLTIC